MLKKPPEIGGLTHKIRKIVFSYFRCPVFAFSVSRFTRVSCEAAVRMMQDMGAHAAKFFPMGGEKSLPELYALATTAARHGMTLIEPTGGISLDNFGIILQTCLEAGVPRVMPHVYSSIIDPQTGNTRPEDVIRLMEIVKALV